MEPYTLVYLLGSGRNGSTVLDFMLAGHPSVLALGEISTINHAYDPFDPPDDDYAAFQSWEANRYFWSRVKSAYESATGSPFKEIDLSSPRLRRALRMGPAEARSWARDSIEVLRAAQAASGRPILTDSSKVPQRLLLLRRSGALRIKVIHLVRDGRAVSCSYLRRYGSFQGGVRTWAHAELGSRHLRRLFADDDWMRIRYEVFATRPDAVIKDVCAFLGLDHHPAMVEFRAHQYLGIGGNPTVRSSMSSLVGLDERWRGELGTARRFAFALKAGWLNRLNGYPAFGWGRGPVPVTVTAAGSGTGSRTAPEAGSESGSEAGSESGSGSSLTAPSR